MRGIARPLLACAGTVATVAVAAGCDTSSDTTTTLAHAGPQRQPNVIVIQTDDQTLASFTRETMPRTQRLLARRGTTFTDYIVTTPQCCPSRATLLTGQYGHNDGVVANTPGYPDLRDPDDILPAWLKEAGYVTAHVGKYLNGYEGVFDATDPPSAWDEWFTFAGHPRYLGFELADGDELRSFDDEYATDVIGERASEIVASVMPTSSPLYLQLDEHAPHADPGRAPCKRSAIPAREDLGGMAAIPVPRAPSFNEADVSDKPSFIRGLPELDAASRSQLERRYRCAVASLAAVDRSVGRLYDAVGDAGELNRTVFVFISDNGFFFGEHRIAHGKSLPYEESIRQPLVMLVPDRYLGGRDAAPSVSLPTANIDLAPTIADLAGACLKGNACRVMDGLSLVPLLEGGEAGFRNRDLLVEFDSAPRSEQRVCKWAAVRSPDAILVRYARIVDDRTERCAPTDQAELYDLRADPNQLRNRFPVARDSRLRSTQKGLEKRLAELRDCAGIKGRDPTPESGHWCG
jgi:N-acetylglucosamine-6-sulfatase